MRKLSITVEIWHKGNVYLTSAPELDFISQGQTFEEAKKNLLEVINIQFDEMTEMGRNDNRKLTICDNRILTTLSYGIIRDDKGGSS